MSFYYIERGINYTKYGGNHQASFDNPNMWLDLRGDHHSHQEHIVVHEFGHALGLGHEHQRPDFWNLIEPFINKSKMQSDIQWVGAFYCHWEVDQNLKIASDYDCESVMHYW